MNSDMEVLWRNGDITFESRSQFIALHKTIKNINFEEAGAVK